jgi:hypothetical protein
MKISAAEQDFNRPIFEKIAFAVSEAIDQAHWCSCPKKSVQQQAALFDALPPEDILVLGFYASDDEIEGDRTKDGRIIWRQPGVILTVDIKTKIWKCRGMRGCGVVAGLAVFVDDSLSNVVGRLFALLGQSLLTIHRDFRLELYAEEKS